MPDVLLSVLVAGLSERRPKEATIHLLDSLYAQAEGKPVEVLYLVDNRQMSVGRKRNILLSVAQGEWLTFVDDDDEVSPQYVDALLAAIAPLREQLVDVINFRQDCIHADTGKIEHCEYSMAYQEYSSGPIEDKENEFWWKGLPAHTMCWRTDRIQDVEFPDGNFGEDVGWVKLAAARVRAEGRLDAVLYTYRFNPATSRTRG